MKKDCVACGKAIPAAARSCFFCGEPQAEAPGDHAATGAERRSTRPRPSQTANTVVGMKAPTPEMIQEILRQQAEARRGGDAPAPSRSAAPPEQTGADDADATSARDAATHRREEAIRAAGLDRHRVATPLPVGALRPGASRTHTPRDASDAPAPPSSETLEPLGAIDAPKLWDSTPAFGSAAIPKETAAMPARRAATAPPSSRRPDDAAVERRAPPSTNDRASTLRDGAASDARRPSRPSADHRPALRDSAAPSARGAAPPIAEDRPTLRDGDASAAPRAARPIAEDGPTLRDGDAYAAPRAARPIAEDARTLGDGDVDKAAPRPRGAVPPIDEDPPTLRDGGAFAAPGGTLPIPHDLPTLRDAQASASGPRDAHASDPGTPHSTESGAHSTDSGAHSSESGTRGAHSTESGARDAHSTESGARDAHSSESDARDAHSSESDVRDAHSSGSGARDVHSSKSGAHEAQPGDAGARDAHSSDSYLPDDLASAPAASASGAHDSHSRQAGASEDPSSRRSPTPPPAARSGDPGAGDAPSTGPGASDDAHSGRSGAHGAHGGDGDASEVDAPRTLDLGSTNADAESDADADDERAPFNAWPLVARTVGGAAGTVLLALFVAAEPLLAAFTGAALALRLLFLVAGSLLVAAALLPLPERFRGTLGALLGASAVLLAASSVDGLEEWRGLLAGAAFAALPGALLLRGRRRDGAVARGLIVAAVAAVALLYVVPADGVVPLRAAARLLASGAGDGVLTGVLLLLPLALSVAALAALARRPLAGFCTLWGTLLVLLVPSAVVLLALAADEASGVETGVALLAAGAAAAVGLARSLAPDDETAAVVPDRHRRDGAPATASAGGAA